MLAQAGAKRADEVGLEGCRGISQETDAVDPRLLRAQVERRGVGAGSQRDDDPATRDHRPSVKLELAAVILPPVTIVPMERGWPVVPVLLRRAARVRDMRAMADMRFEITDLGSDFYRLLADYGFKDDPDVPELLEDCGRKGFAFHMIKRRSSCRARR